MYKLTGIKHHPTFTGEKVPIVVEASTIPELKTKFLALLTDSFNSKEIGSFHIAKENCLQDIIFEDTVLGLQFPFFDKKVRLGGNNEDSISDIEYYFDGYNYALNPKFTINTDVLGISLDKYKCSDNKITTEAFSIIDYDRDWNIESIRTLSVGTKPISLVKPMFRYNDVFSISSIHDNFYLVLVSHVNGDQVLMVNLFNETIELSSGDIETKPMNFVRESLTILLEKAMEFSEEQLNK